MKVRTRRGHGLVLLLSTAMVAIATTKALAELTGGVGNEPLHIPGWPAGAAAIFNTKARIAWWEGPPLGGGEWHAECRGDAKALNAVLADFAKLDVKAKRIVVHDGVGQSFWLSAVGDPGKRDAAKMDWSFTVWQKASWERQRKLPAGLKPPTRPTPKTVLPHNSTSTPAAISSGPTSLCPRASPLSTTAWKPTASPPPMASSWKARSPIP